MIRQIQEALKEVLMSFSSHRSQQEAMMKMDFKIGIYRTQFMQLCFSNLGSWPILFLLVIIYFDPTRYSWTLQKTLTGWPELAYLLLDGRWPMLLGFFLLFYILEWVFRFETLFLGIIFYFLHKSDIHLNLALAGVVGILLSKASYLWWLHTDLKSRALDIWKTYCYLQIIGVLVASCISVYLLELLRLQSYFSATPSVNRFEFLFLSLISIYLLQFIFSSIWGHFKFKEKHEPADFPTNYSTATWILRIKLRPYFKKLLDDQVKKYTLLHQENLADLSSLKDLGPVSIPHQISQILKTELEFLKLASSRLTID